ncbi:MAG: hypothetical protein OEZ06_21435 [Myxococcales bacterium]|nr:hypothetical protein [Myxococcales bacterium]
MPKAPELLAAAGAALSALLFLLALVLKRKLASLRQRRRALRAVRGEEEGAALLLQRGYRIDARQAQTRWAILFGGERREIALRADYLVSRGGKRWVAEVKTGSRAPSIGHAPTRRQILEYRHAFDVDGALLVEPERGCVTEVDFPALSRSRPTGWQRPLLWLTLGAAIGAVLARFQS